MFKHCPECANQTIELYDSHYFKCSHCDFTYFHNVAAATAAILILQNKILMTRRAKAPAIGALDLPGGFVDPNESLHTALSREIKEELNLDISDWRYYTGLPNTYTYREIQYNTMDIVFIHEFTCAPNISIEKDEILSVEWIALDELDTSLMAFKSLRTAVEQYIAETQSRDSHS